MINGRIVHSHIIQKLYQYPLGFGSACAVIVVKNEEVEKLGKKFVLENTMEGFSNTEFKYDPVSAKYFFIETNPRVWQQIELTASLGDNLMVRYYQFLTEGVTRPVSFPLKYKKLWIDLPSFTLLYYKFRKESGLGLGKLVKYLVKANYYGVFNLLDLNPFIKTVVLK
jgi:predicted ATP-grasp superfamily ATP-dependent carboligase